MNACERVIRAIAMTGPDRVPVSHSTLPGAWRRHGDALRALYARYPADVLLVGDTGAGEYGGAAGVRSVDAWGATWVSASDDHKGQVEAPLLPTWDDLPRLRAPIPVVPVADLEQGLGAIADNAGAKYVLCDGDTLWQRMFYLRGFEPLVVDLMVEPEQAALLRDLILEFMLERIAVWSAAGVDGFQVRDDWGTQESLIVSPALWRRFFRPAYRAIADACHAAGKHLWFHSDGQIATIIPDLLDIGADVINPQPTVMGIERLSREFGGRVCFLGDIDRQSVLPFGTQAQVRAHVCESIAAFGRFSGGYIAQGQIAVDVTLANAEAMLQAFADCGRYVGPEPAVGEDT